MQTLYKLKKNVSTTICPISAPYNTVLRAEETCWSVRSLLCWQCKRRAPTNSDTHTEFVHVAFSSKDEETGRFLGLAGKFQGRWETVRKALNISLLCAHLWIYKHTHTNTEICTYADNVLNCTPHQRRLQAHNKHILMGEFHRFRFVFTSAA